MDENTASTISISASLSIGPLLFAEFCVHCYELEQTSVVSSTPSQPTEISLAQLSMRAFALCVRGMGSFSKHSLSKAQRVNALLTSAMRAASSAAPESDDSWKYYQGLTQDSVKLDGLEVTNEDLALKKSLLPFVSHRNDNEGSRVCLFSELLLQSMNAEAMELSSMLLAAAASFSEPNMKEQLGVSMLHCWEHSEIVDGFSGVLGLDHGEGFKLTNDLDGETHVPLPSFRGLNSGSKGEAKLRAARSKSGLPTSQIASWPEKHQERLRKELFASNGCPSIPGIVQQMAWALTATFTAGERFNKTFAEDSPSPRQLVLKCVKRTSKTSDSNLTREKTNLAGVLSSSIEAGLSQADFVTLRLIPHMTDKPLDSAQRFVSSLLLSVCRVICASAPSAENLDTNGSFSSSLLKSTKRLYSILVRFILSYAANPQKLTCDENKCFFDFMTSTLMPRISALLVTLQELQETVEGKYLAESKIESHGKTAAALVFEKEKLDNALLRVGSMLKQHGLEEDAMWLEKHVVTTLNRDFGIKSIQDAKEREAPKKRKSATLKKSRVKSEGGKQKKEKRAKPEPMSEHEDDVDAASVADDESEAVSCEVLTEDVDDDDDDESSDDDGDVLSMGNLTEDLQSEEEEEDSDSEVEFDG
eukprot:scaffold3786_cov204-Alexandrium_tamarense.AAC.31